MNNTGKALLGWILICLVIVFSGGLWAGIGTFIIGIGVCLLVTPVIEWMTNEGMEN